MKVKHILALLLAGVSIPMLADEVPGTYKQALELYERGMYGRARTIFESLGDNPLSQGYAVLCAEKTKSPDYEYKIDRYRDTYGTTILTPQIDYQYGLILFDQSDYAGASRLFSLVKANELDSECQSEFAFKKGYSSFSRGIYPDARENFWTVENLPLSEYTAPSRYAMGYMSYTDKDFVDAEKWFTLSADDPRFEELSRFYLVDSRFNRKDYDYVIENGVPLYDKASGTRRERLARIISESYLVKGDKENARLYFDSASRDNMTRSDYFYAGSVLYAVEDYEGAIKNYSMMTDRSDSLGQIANYQMANAYLNTKNRVAAMNAFKDASRSSANPEMQEDALFNYAKMAFDLNKDNSGFISYMDKYNTSKRGDQIYGYMALVNLNNRDYAAAVEAYDHIDDLDSDQRENYIKAYYLRAEQLISSGAYTQAIPCLKAAAYYLPQTDRLNQLARYWQAESCYRTENYDESARTFADLYNISALQGEKEGALLPYNVAYSHLKKAEYPQASRWFDVYISEKNPLYREDALIRRADCDFVSRDYKAAIVSYQRVMDEPGFSGAIYPYYQQALAYDLTGDKKKAASVLAAVENAPVSDPMYAEATYELGRAYMDLNSNEAAVSTFARLESTAKDNETKAKALIGLGMANRNLKDYDEALDCYKQVVDLVPGSEYADDALLAIESIYQTRKQPEKYLEYVEQKNLAAGKSEADKEKMYFNTAEQVYLAGNYVQAVTLLQKYLDSYPSGSRKDEAYFYMADSYRQTGNKEKACTYYQMVMKSGTAGSFSELSTISYADLSYSLERYQEAYSAYSDLVTTARMDANKAAARTGMMRSAYKGRDYAAAIAAADAVSSQSSTDSDLLREATYIKAKSCLMSSRRDEAMQLFKKLSAEPATSEGAEASYMLVQDACDRADYDQVQKLVYAFSGKSGDQNYWLARTYIALADSFVEQGKKEQAKATYESIRDGYTPASQDDDILGLVEHKLSQL